ncbi:MAG: signal peptidase I [Lachnospiraceae bacterium]|nr:signal peptidase I [Lachnospiraceae bacterium]
MLKRFLLKTLLLIIGGILLFTLVFRVKRWEGNAMSPFVRDGDLCIFLRSRTVSAGEIVLYQDPDGERRIGRIAAVSGQEIDLLDSGGYTVDGYEPLEEIPYETAAAEESSVTYPLKLGENQLFILNDFRSVSEDSRSFGPVDGSQVFGSLLLLFRRRGF